MHKYSTAAADTRSRASSDASNTSLGDDATFSPQSKHSHEMRHFERQGASSQYSKFDSNSHPSSPKRGAPADDTDMLSIQSSSSTASETFNANISLMRSLFTKYHKSLILPAMLTTPAILLLFVLSTFPNWRNSLLIIAALSPVLLMILCHIIDFRSIPLQHYAVFSGMISVGVAIFFEVAFHGAVYALFSYFQMPAFKDVVVQKGSAFHISRVMTQNPAIRIIYLAADTLFVGFIEELCKVAAPLTVYYVFMRKQRQRVVRAEKRFMFRYLWVLAVVTVCSSLGFALLENVKYVLMTSYEYEHVNLRRPVHSWWLDRMGYENYPFLMGILVAMERAMISFPAHIMFSLCGMLGVMEFMLWKQRDQSTWNIQRQRLSNSEYMKRKKENLMHEIYLICKWLTVGMQFHSAFDFLLMYTRESHVQGYMGNVLVLSAHLLIPVSIYVFVSRFIQLDLAWYELIYLQVVEVDVKRDQSKRLLATQVEDEDLDQFTEGDLSGVKDA